MRDIVSCLSENAVNVSPYSSCASYSSNNNNCINPTTTTNLSLSPSTSPSVQNSVSSVYRLVLSNLKQVIITVTWCKSHSNQGLSIAFGVDHSNPSSAASAPFRLNTNSRFFRKKKGSKLLEHEEHKVEILWDLSNARYESGPEPIEGFCVLILADSDIGLILGENKIAEETMPKKLFKSNPKFAKSYLLSRREHCSGNTLYATKAQFSDTGICHEVIISCGAESQGLKQRHPVLSVCIDKKTVIRVKRLQWNFRGNQTIFVDGLLVDLLWDVHDWFFSAPVSGSPVSGSGSAVFMFRTRSGLDSRLWLEDKSGGCDQEFSLLIYACKTS